MQEILITGNIGKDAEVTRRKDGQEVLAFTVAVSNGKESNGEERKPTWFSVFVIGNYQNVAPYLVKGTRVLVRGQMRARAYTNRHGETGVSLDISTNTSGVEIQKFADDNNVGSKAVSQSQPRSPQTRQQPMPQGQGWQTAQQMQQRQSGEKLF